MDCIPLTRTFDPKVRRGERCRDGSAPKGHRIVSSMSNMGHGDRDAAAERFSAGLSESTYTGGAT